MYARTHDRRRTFDADFIPPVGGGFMSGGPAGFGGPGPDGRRGGGRFAGGPGMHRGRRVRRGLLRESVLRLLTDQSLNGYQIMTTLAEKTLDTWQPSPGAIYPCLNQLEDEGLIIATQDNGQKVYTLTEAGQAAAEQVPAEPWAGSGPQGNPAQTMMWEQFRTLAHTWRYANQTASAEQMPAIAAELEKARKAILAILAQTE